MAYSIEVHLTGEDISPEKLSSRYIGGLIANIEEMLAPIIAENNPALKLDESDVTIGLSRIKQGSYVMQFTSQYEKPLAAAMHMATSAIAAQDYSNIPDKSIKAMEDIRKTIRKGFPHSEAEFWEINGQGRRLAVIGPDTEFTRPERDTFSGFTTLYGYLTGIVGEDPPHVHVRLINGEKKRFDVTRKDNLRVARQIAERLYTKVGLRGEATWYVDDLSLKAFRVVELTDYSGASVGEAFAELRKTLGPHWDDVEDVEAFIAEIRGKHESD